MDRASGVDRASAVDPASAADPASADLHRRIGAGITAVAADCVHENCIHQHHREQEGHPFESDRSGGRRHAATQRHEWRKLAHPDDPHPARTATAHNRVEIAAVAQPRTEHPRGQQPLPQHFVPVQRHFVTRKRRGTSLPGQRHFVTRTAALRYPDSSTFVPGQRHPGQHVAVAQLQAAPSSQGFHAGSASSDHRPPNTPRRGAAGSKGSDHPSSGNNRSALRVLQRTQHATQFSQE